MITNKEEAFEHNSCKKLAQLSKVIFSMSMQCRDRNDELNDISNEYEDFIAEIVHNYRNKAESISKQLVNFRKNCIDNCCKEFGSSYKSLKTELSNLQAKQMQNMNLLYQDVKSLKNEISSFQAEVLKEATAALEAANSLETDLKPRGTRPTTAYKNKISVAIQPILEKMIKIQEESEQHLLELRKNQASLISQNRNGLAEFLRNEIGSRLSKYQLFKKEVVSLLDSVSLIRKQQLNLVKSHATLFKNRISEQDNLIYETKRSINNMKKEINQLQQKEKSQEKNRKLEIKNAKKQSSQNKISHQESIDMIMKEINEQRHKRHCFLNSKSNETKKQEEAHKHQTETSNQGFEKAVQYRNSIHEEVVDGLNNCENETQKILESLKKNIINQTENLNNQKSLFNSKLQTLQDDARSRYDNEKSWHFIILDSLINSVLSTCSQINILCNNAKEKDKIKIDQLKKEIVHNQNILDTDKKNIIEKNQKEIENFKSSCASRQNFRREQNEEIYSKKALEKEKRIDEMQKHFKEDLTFKQQQKNDEIAKICYDFELESEKNISNQDQLKAHDVSMAKLSARLDFAKQQIEEKKSIWEKKLQYIRDQETITLKNQRQIQRHIKTETGEICNDYEIKIQIEQVALQDKIEALGKLYDAEENVRGCEIIEAVRKVREINNRTNDLLLKKQRELDQLQQNNKEVIETLKQAIDDCKNEKKEAELKESLAQKKKQRETDINKANQLSQNDSLKIQNEIDQNENDIRNEKTNIQMQMDKEQLEYENALDSIQKQIDSIHSCIETRKKEIANKYAAQIKASKEKHKKSILASKAKIESAESQRIQLDEKHKVEKETILQKYLKETNRRNEDLKKFQSSNSKNCEIDEIHKIISSLIEKNLEELDYQLQKSIIEPNEAEKKAIEKDTANIHSLDAEITNLFQQHQQNIKESPELFSQESIQEEKLSKEKPIGRNQTSRKEGRNLLTSEGRKKRDPQVITPQISN